MLLGARQFFERRGAPTPSLPYDAEVDYLESTGTQYIDTGVGGHLYDKFVSCRFSFVAQPSSNRFVFNSQTSKSNRLCLAANANGDFLAAMNSNVAIIANFDTQWHVLEISSKKYDRYILFDGERHRGDTVQGSTAKSTNFFIFSGNNGTNPITARISSFSVRDISTNELLTDLVPVRFTNEQGQSEGAMYDRVSGQLFRNAGTGAFIYGPDKS